MSAHENGYRPKFEPVFNLGQVGTIISFAAAAVAVYYGFDGRLTSVEKTLSQLTSVVITTAQQEQRISANDRRLDRIEKVMDRANPLPAK